MIYRGGFRAYRIFCDSCEKEEDVGFESVREGIVWARDHNWKAQRVADGEYEHICPACQREQGLLPNLPEEPPSWVGRRVPDFF